MVPMSLDLTHSFAPVLGLGLVLFLAAAVGVALGALQRQRLDGRGGPVAKQPQPQPA